MKKIIVRLLNFFNKRKQLRQLDEINQQLESGLKKRTTQRVNTNMKIIKYSQKRIRNGNSRFIPVRKIDRVHLFSECEYKFRNDLNSCDAVLTSSLKVKPKKII